MKSANKIPIIYNLFPRLTGSMDQWTKHFDRAKKMGFNWIYINPISYTGFSGSLYSIKDYLSVNPIFLDKSTIPEWDQVRQMIKKAHQFDLKIMYDLVINHTAIDANLIKEEPDWYKRKEDGSIKNAEVWEGDKLVTIWGDLAEIDNYKNPKKKELRKYWLKVINFYSELGFDGFRCDAAYQVPAELWEYIITEIKQKKPNSLFFAETLGCEIKDVIDLSQSGFDFVFNSSKYWDFEEKWCLTQYYETAEVSPSISFSESHDTQRLAKELQMNESAIKMRYLFSVLFSTGVMMPIGFEYGFQKQVNVVQTTPDDWETAPLHLEEFISDCNWLKQEYSVFTEDNELILIETNQPKIFAFLKINNNKSEKALVVINKDLHHHQHINLNIPEIIQEPLTKIKDISIEYPLADIPEIIDYHLRPAQVMIFHANSF